MKKSNYKWTTNWTTIQRVCLMYFKAAIKVFTKIYICTSQCHLNSFSNLIVRLIRFKRGSKQANLVKRQFRLCYLVCVWIRMWFVRTTFECFPAFSISSSPFAIHFDSFLLQRFFVVQCTPSCASTNLNNRDKYKNLCILQSTFICSLSRIICFLSPILFRNTIKRFKN